MSPVQINLIIILLLSGTTHELNTTLNSLKSSVISAQNELANRADTNTEIVIQKINSANSTTENSANSSTGKQKIQSGSSSGNKKPLPTKKKPTKNKPTKKKPNTGTTGKKKIKSGRATSSKNKSGKK